jgi:glucosamine--fructose-6-phosphate aminotransferase (isomerizing)
VPDSLPIIEGHYLRDLLEQPSALENTLAGLTDSDDLHKIARRLHGGEFHRIILTGMGSSFHGLHPLNLDLISHGFTALMVETSELAHYMSCFFDPKTLVVAVSQSGQSAEMLRLVEMNHGRSLVIAITNTENSVLAKHAGTALITRAGNEFSVSCKTYVTALMASKWLGAILCQHDTQQIRRDLKRAAPAVAAYLADWKDYVVALMQMLRPAQHLFVVGRGASLAAVGTGALIVKEADHFHAEGMSSAAFRHGPMEMSGDETFVLVLSGDPKTRELNRRLLSDIQQQGGRAELVGEDAVHDCFRLPDHGAAVRPILEILPVQMITLALAAQSGREPGKFERATKVTTTE